MAHQVCELTGWVLITTYWVIFWDQNNTGYPVSEAIYMSKMRNGIWIHILCRFGVEQRDIRYTSVIGRYLNTDSTISTFFFQIAL